MKKSILLALIIPLLVLTLVSADSYSYSSPSYNQYSNPSANSNKNVQINNQVQTTNNYNLDPRYYSPLPANYQPSSINQNYNPYPPTYNNYNDYSLYSNNCYYDSYNCNVYYRGGYVYEYYSSPVLRDYGNLPQLVRYRIYFDDDHYYRHNHDYYDHLDRRYRNHRYNRDY